MKETVQIGYIYPEIQTNLCNPLRGYLTGALVGFLKLKVLMLRTVFLTIVQAERAQNALSEAIADICQRSIIAEAIQKRHLTTSLTSLEFML